MPKNKLFKYLEDKSCSNKVIEYVLFEYLYNKIINN